MPQHTAEHVQKIGYYGIHKHGDMVVAFCVFKKHHAGEKLTYAVAEKADRGNGYRKIFISQKQRHHRHQKFADKKRYKVAHCKRKQTLVNSERVFYGIKM